MLWLKPYKSYSGGWHDYERRVMGVGCRCLTLQLEHTLTFGSVPGCQSIICCWPTDQLLCQLLSIISQWSDYWPAAFITTFYSFSLFWRFSSPNLLALFSTAPVATPPLTPFTPHFSSSTSQTPRSSPFPVPVGISLPIPALAKVHFSSYPYVSPTQNTIRCFQSGLQPEIQPFYGIIRGFWLTARTNEPNHEGYWVGRG